MSTRSQKEAGGGGLSAVTLAIASASSVAAAYFIHNVWQGGAILGAAFTPIIVAIVSESLKRPTARLAAIREERRDRGEVAQSTPADVPAAPPPELERPDPHGVWEADREPRFAWLRGRPLKIAVATGLLAFAIGAFVVTGADLVFGEGGGGDRFTIVPGKQDRRDRDEEPARTTTVPGQTTQTAPEDEEEEEEEPTETAPDETTTQPPPTTPGQTAPAPGTPPQQPAPQQPAPATP